MAKKFFYKNFFFKKIFFVKDTFTKKIFLFFILFFCAESLRSKNWSRRNSRRQKVGRGEARDFAKKGVVPPSVFFCKKMQKKCIFREKKAFFCDFSPNFCQKSSKNHDFSRFFFFRRGAMLTKKRVSRSIVRVAKTRQFIQY